MRKKAKNTKVTLKSFLDFLSYYILLKLSRLVNQQKNVLILKDKDFDVNLTVKVGMRTLQKARVDSGKRMMTQVDLTIFCPYT